MPRMREHWRRRRPISPPDVRGCRSHCRRTALCRARRGCAAPSRTCTTARSFGRCSSGPPSCWHRPRTRNCSTAWPAAADSAVRLLPLPLDLSAVPDTFESGFLRARAGFPPDVPIVLFLGRIHRLKGLDVLADAMGPLLDAGEAVLAVVGRDDGSWDEIAARARRRDRKRAAAVHRAALRRRALSRLRRRRRVRAHAAPLGGDVGCGARGRRVRHGARSHRASGYPGSRRSGGGSRDRVHARGGASMRSGRPVAAGDGGERPATHSRPARSRRRRRAARGLPHRRVSACRRIGDWSRA